MRFPPPPNIPPATWKERLLLVWLPLLVAAAVLVALLARADTPGAAEKLKGKAVDCGPAAFPVSTPDHHVIRGTLCRPNQPRVTLLLVHGSTYDSRYWSPPGAPAQYQALRLLAKAGYQSVAIDRLGSGQSSRPPNGQVTADASADALHQVIRKLRRDPTTRIPGGKLFTVGHSSSSSLIIREAARYDDVDGVITTGFLHTPGVKTDMFTPLLHPASEDPKFQGNPAIPDGYVTTQPGVRIAWYYGWQAEEAVYELDERTLKDAMPSTDSGGFVDERFGEPRSLGLDVPVLVVVGDRDLDNCTLPACPQLNAERAFYPNSPDVQVAKQRRTGHALNLHANAADTTGIIARWAAQHS